VSTLPTDLTTERFDAYAVETRRQLDSGANLDDVVARLEQKMLTEIGAYFGVANKIVAKAQVLPANGHSKPKEVEMAQAAAAEQTDRIFGVDETAPSEALVTATAQAARSKVSAPTFFESIALPLVEKGFMVCPVYPHDSIGHDGKNQGKKVHGGLVPNPLAMQSADPAQLARWGQAEPNANVCVYAEQKPGGLLFVDKDGAVDLRAKFERETGKKFPATLLVCSSVVPDGNGGTNVKGHWYFRQTARTIELPGNVSEDKTGGVFSLRVKNYYVASIGSIHPTTKVPYSILENNAVLPIPDDLLDWLLAQVVSAPKNRQETAERGKIAKGMRYNALISEAGKLWNRNYSREDTIEMSVKWARNNFEIIDGAFNENLVRQEVEHLIDSYAPGDPTAGQIQFTAQQTDAAAKASQQEEFKWREIVAVDDILSPVMPFNPNFLPDSIRAHAIDVSERMAVPLDFPGICSLVVLAGAIGRRAFVYVKALDKGWKESICLPGAVIAESGKTKTPTWKIFTNVATAQDIEWREKYKQQKAAWDKKKKTWDDAEKENKKTMARIRKGKATAEELITVADPGDPPTCRRLITNDATPEKLHDMLKDNPQGMFIYRDEGSSWVAEMEKEGRELERGLILAATNGNDQHDVGRMGREGGYAKMCATVFCGFQPTPFRNFMSVALNTDDGTIPRFPLLVWPNDQEFQEIDRPENHYAKDTYRRILYALADLREESIQLHFDPEAQKLCDEFRAMNKKRILSEVHSGKRSHMNKYNGAVARIAGLFQLIDLVDGLTNSSVSFSDAAPQQPTGGTLAGKYLIDKKHAQKAIDFLDYLTRHMHRVYDCIRSGIQKAELALAGHLKNGDLTDGFTVYDVRRNHWGDLDKKDNIEMALGNLQQKGWVWGIEHEPNVRGGRPTVRWVINPASGKLAGQGAKTLPS
jgi:hypothetical protein